MAKYPKVHTRLVDKAGCVWAEGELTQPRVKALIKQYQLSDIWLEAICG
jgi:hypothetical protein